MSARRVVVVGSGASGFALATRLGQAGHVVTLLEGAASAASIPRPVRDLSGAMPGAPTALGYRTDLRPDGGYVIARGSTLGGSSAVNGGYFLRAHPSDFATWTLAGGDEWSYESCLPALRLLESDADFGDSDVHGGSGPVTVERPRADDLTARFIAAAAAGGGAVLEADKNGGGPSGVGRLACNVRAGIRWGADLAYGPLARDVVQIVTGARAVRVLFADDVVVGLETIQGRETRVVAADEVIIACGAVETPRLLRRSGIGARSDLTAPPLVESDAVGHGLSDHPAINLRWLPRAGVLDDASEVGWSAAWNAPPNAVSRHPFEILNAAVPTATIITGTRGADGPVDLRVSMSAVGVTGRGEIRETEAGPVIRYDYLGAPDERESLRTAVRAGLDLLRSPELSPAVDAIELVAALGADPSDHELDAWIRDELATSLHTVGTARMGDGRGDAVVDGHGRVFGVSGLRVADCSILPTVPSRGTSNTAFLIGERMAQLIADEDQLARSGPLALPG